MRISDWSSDVCSSDLFDRRHFVINCPIDVHLRLNLTGGGMEITNVLAAKSPIRAEALQRWIVFQPRHEWRNPQRPGLPMLTSYVFVSDEPVYVNPYPHLFHYSPHRPGLHSCKVHAGGKGGSE